MGLEESQETAAIHAPSDAIRAPRVSPPPADRDETLRAVAKSDARGKWRLDGLPAEGVGVLFYGTGYRRTEVAVEVDREDIAVTVPRAARFAGRVVDGATGASIRSFTLRVVHTATGIEATWVREGYRFADPEGRWARAQTGGSDPRRWSPASSCRWSIPSARRSSCARSARSR
jgi:hypothetical protein